ncbi:hypothetical protein [Streptomyces sp. NBC_00009]|uniref:hypothetical protein n=1 Tax=Streptomyces sp. NBC_00009 TaxID=2975620 RepID=UPI00324D8040
MLTTAQVCRLDLEVLRGEQHFAYDGEVTDATYQRLVLDKIPKALTLYRPADLTSGCADTRHQTKEGSRTAGGSRRPAAVACRVY